EADMIAADGTMGERLSVIVRRAEAKGDARQPRHRLDHPDELRRPEDAAELPEARGEIGNADGAAVAIGEHRRHHRGIAQVFGLEIGHIVEHDVAKSLLLVGRKQTAEDRIAVEAGIAPPYQTRGRIDERGRASVTDDGKIKPVVGHEVANASLRETCASQRRTSAGCPKRASTPGTFRPTEMPMPSKSGRISNTPRSVTSSP